VGTGRATKSPVLAGAAAGRGSGGSTEGATATLEISVQKFCPLPNSLTRLLLHGARVANRNSPSVFKSAQTSLLSCFSRSPYCLAYRYLRSARLRSRAFRPVPHADECQRLARPRDPDGPRLLIGRSLSAMFRSKGRCHPIGGSGLAQQKAPQ